MMTLAAASSLQLLTRCFSALQVRAHQQHDPKMLLSHLCLDSSALIRP